MSNICLTNGLLISTKIFDNRSRLIERTIINSWRTQRFVSTPISCEAKWSDDGYSTRQSSGRPSHLKIDDIDPPTTGDGRPAARVGAVSFVDPCLAQREGAKAPSLPAQCWRWCSQP